MDGRLQEPAQSVHMGLEPAKDLNGIFSADTSSAQELLVEQLQGACLTAANKPAPCDWVFIEIFKQNL